MMPTDSLLGSSRVRNRSAHTVRAFAVIGLLFWSTPELSADTVTAAWDRNSESNIAGYILSYGTQSGNYSTSIDVGNVTTRQVVLNPGQRYYFVVQAYNTSSLVSPRSAEVFVDVGVATGAPNVSSLSPTSGSVGTAVAITGTNFGATQGTSTVRFNGSVATPTSWSATRIVASVPGGAATGNIVVTVGGVASNGVSFTVVGPVPSITTRAPTSGTVGTPVTITGANFGATKGTSTVTFNRTLATPTIWSATSLVVPVPAGAVTGNIVVTVGGVASNGVAFTVSAGTNLPPTLTQPANQTSAENAIISLPLVASDPDGYAQAVLSDAPYGYWQLGDASGTVAVDSAAAPHHGTYTGGVTLAQAGAFTDGGRAVDFNGSTGQVTNAASLGTLTGPSTIEAWVWADTISATNRRMIFAGRTTSYLSLNTNGRIFFSLDVSGAQVFLAGTTPVSRGAWHHLAGTWDGDKLRVYLDGVLDATSVSFTPGTVRWGTGTFRIGAYDGTAPDNFWDGKVDEVALYPTGLSLQQIANHYARRTSTLTYSATGLPASLSINASTGLISGTLSYASAGTYAVTATVSDGALTNSKTFTWTVSNVNRAPTLTQPANQTSAENTTISLPLAASDPDGTAPAYSATGLPASLSINAATGVIAGTLTSTSAGTYTVTATASDGSLTNSKTFTWTVTDAAQAPNITSLSPTSGSVGTAVMITGTNFGATQGTSTVRFNGRAATPTSWSATRIVAAVPSGATTGLVTVTVGGVASNGVSFTVGPPTTSPITLTQHAGINTGGMSTTLAFPANNVAGNFIMVAARARYANQTFTVSDARSNVYRRALTVNNGTDDTLALFYAENITAGPNTVTVAVSPGPASIRLAILEYAGIARANALDVTATAAGSSASPSSGSATTTAAGDLVIGVFSTQSGRTFTAGSGSTIREAVSAAPSTNLMVQDRIQATAGAVTATATVNTPDIWGAAIAAFKKASGTAPAALTSETPSSSGVVSTVSTSLVAPPRTDDDYDGDGKADVAVWTPSTATWSILESNTGTALTGTLGAPGDRPVPGDYEGDGKTDIAVYRPATGEWSVLLSSTGALTAVTWGSATDLPVPADYDRDGKTDLAVYRPTTGEWIILQSTTHTTRTVVWGSSADVPVPGDYDGDGKADLAVYRPTTGLWQILQSGTNTTTTATWGSPGAIAMPGDYDGDGRIDVAVYDASTGLWSILQSSTNTIRTVTWGSSSDVPMPGDYDGDGTTDLAVFRPSTGLWQILQSSTNATTALTWGMSGEIPLL